MANTAGQATALSVLCPVHLHRLGALEKALATLPLGEASPLARVGSTHFARWVVIEQLVYEGEAQKPDTLSRPYLLFTSNFDGDMDEYLLELCRASLADLHAVWSHCVGCPERRSARPLADYLKCHRVDTTMFYAAYPQATVADVRRCLALRQQFSEFAVRSQSLDPSALMRGFQRRFGRALA
jgi:hypothetical protein